MKWLHRRRCAKRHAGDCEDSVILKCMKTRQEKQWEMMQRVLAAEAQGKSPQPVVSKRTLFGIPSSVDQAIAKIAAEEDERCERIMRQRKDDQLNCDE